MFRLSVIPRLPARTLCLLLLLFPLAAMAVPASIDLPSPPSAGGAKAAGALTLLPIEVYAADARVRVIENGVVREIPRSRQRFYAATRSDGSGAWLGVAEDGRQVDGATFSSSGVQAFSGVLRDGVVEVTASRAVDGSGHSFTCGGAPAAEPPLPGTVRRARNPDGTLLALPKGDTLLEARVAVDTDSELLSLKFGDNTTSANNYIAALFAGMNTMYERDLNVRLVVGDVMLRVGSDPYASAPGVSTSVQLNEFGEYWRVNHQAINRAFAMLLSGKSANEFQASGTAWVLTSGNYCTAKGTLQNGDTQTSGHFSATQVFRSDNTALDVSVVGHELGHNFGAFHTHCTDRDPVTAGLQPIDQCFNSDNPPPGGACYTGTRSCPTEFPAHTNRGTVMSYCNFSGSSGGAASCGQVVQEFHPVHEVLLGERITANAGFGCLTSAQGADPNYVFDNGFESP